MTEEERAERVQLAYEMAWFIHHNKQIAYLIAMESVYRWEVLPPQGQRLLSKEQKFQRLVFEVSTYFERAIEVINAGNETQIREQVRHLAANLHHLGSPKESITNTIRKYLSLLTPIAVSLEDRTMMTHYLKHLAMIALRHSFVKTTVSHLQLLYRFATSETRSVYEHLESSLEKAGEAKDLQFFAKARRELLDDLRKRFGDLLRIDLCRAPNGATTHQLAASSATRDQADFVEECLREFAPRDVRRSPSTPDRLRNKGEFVYQLLYPEQFQVVLTEAGLSAAPQPMFWPVFTSRQRPAGPPSPRRSPSLHGREISAALSRLSLAAKRRQQWCGRMLHILVDGCEYAWFNLDEASQTTLQLSDRPCAIEVLGRTEDGDILLAQYLPCEDEFDPKHRPKEQAVVLGGGQKITFAVRPGADNAGAEVTIGYREPFMARIARRTNPQSSSPALTPATTFAPASARTIPLLFRHWRVAAGLATVCLVILLGWQVSHRLLIPSTVTWEDLPAIASTSTDPAARDRSNRQTLGSHIGTQASPASERQQQPSLCDISNLRFEAIGGDRRLYQRVEARLARRLSADGAGLLAITGKERANAILRINAGWQYGILDWISDTALIEVGLYLDGNGNTDGDKAETLWPASTGEHQYRGRQYQGDSDSVIEAIAQDLIDAKRDSCKSK